MAGALALTSGMLVSIRRGAEGRRFSEALEQLGIQERAERAALAGAMAQSDSLTSRDRLLKAGAALGLRPASDGEIAFLAEPGRGDRPREVNR